MRVQEIITESKATIKEGPIGTAVGAGLGAMAGGPLGAAIGGVAGSWAGDKAAGAIDKVKSGWKAFKKGWQSGTVSPDEQELSVGVSGKSDDGHTYRYKGELSSTNKLPKPGKKGDAYKIGKEFYTYWDGPDYKKDSSIDWKKSQPAAGLTTAPSAAGTATSANISMKTIRNSIKSLSPKKRARLRKIIAAKVGAQ